MKIRVLSDTVASQIAAGEVIERPASIVRELVDNALDAEATDILVELEGGGTSLVRVVDNGIGMGRDDALLAFERHATSKLVQVNDLLALHTRGFRGEALAAIASVSRVNLLTRSRFSEVDTANGTLVRIHGGKMVEVGVARADAGTSIDIRNLFFNTPARRKFLRSDRTELNFILAWIAGTALTAPGVRITVLNDGKEVFTAVPSDSEVSRARAMMSGTLVPISCREGEFSVAGLLGHPGSARSKTAPLFLLVNNRLVRDGPILRAIREGFGTTLRDRELPVGLVHVRLPQELLDINVHPQKAEVRFADVGVVIGLVRRAVSDGFAAFRAPISFPSTSLASTSKGELPRLTNFGASSVASANVGYSAPQQLGFSSSMPRSSSYGSFASGNSALSAAYNEPAASLQVIVGGEGTTPATECRESVPNLDLSQRPDFRFQDVVFIGQILKCYLIGEWRDNLIVVDMHAAHERINFAKLLAEVHASEARGELPPVQELLLRVAIPSPPLEEPLRAELVVLLRGVGIWIEVSDTELVLCGVHSLFTTHGMTTEDVMVLIATTATELSGFGHSHTELSATPFTDTPMRVRDFLLSRIACHASVRSGDRLNGPEVSALCRELDITPHSSSCPHGRPVVVSVPANDIAGWFARGS